MWIIPVCGTIVCILRIPLSPPVSLFITVVDVNTRDMSMSPANYSVLIICYFWIHRALYSWRTCQFPLFRTHTFVYLHVRDFYKAFILKLYNRPASVRWEIMVGLISLTWRQAGDATQILHHVKTKICKLHQEEAKSCKLNLLCCSTINSCRVAVTTGISLAKFPESRGRQKHLCHWLSSSAPVTRGSRGKKGRCLTKKVGGREW